MLFIGTLYVPTVNVDIFACINFCAFPKIGNFGQINIRVVFIFENRVPVAVLQLDMYSFNFNFFCIHRPTDKYWHVCRC